MELKLRIPFRTRGHSGVVSIEYGMNEAPERWGNGLLMPSEPGKIWRNFPICRAQVSYDGEGYLSIMGWIQVVRVLGTESGVLVDQPPQLVETGMPYSYWGPSPAFFDNPYTNRKGLHWRAEAFLVVSPDVVMTRVVQPVCGFTWGYSTQSDHVESLPLLSVPAEAWTAVVPLLAERFPRWIFRDEWASELVWTKDMSGS